MRAYFNGKSIASLFFDKDSPWSHKHFQISIFFETIARTTGQMITKKEWLDKNFMSYGIAFDNDLESYIYWGNNNKNFYNAFFKDRQWLKENVLPEWKKHLDKIRNVYKG